MGFIALILQSNLLLSIPPPDATSSQVRLSKALPRHSQVSRNIVITALAATKTITSSSLSVLISTAPWSKETKVYSSSLILSLLPVEVPPPKKASRFRYPFCVWSPNDAGAKSFYPPPELAFDFLCTFCRLLCHTIQLLKI